jgi:hypothetical protein
VADFQNSSLFVQIFEAKGLIRGAEIKRGGFDFVAIFISGKDRGKRHANHLRRPRLRGRR